MNLHPPRFTVLLVASLLSACANLAPSAPTPEPCNYATAPGDEFVFTRPNVEQTWGRRDGLTGWKRRLGEVKEPEDLRPLPFAPYVGHRGKLSPEAVSDPYGSRKYRNAVLDDCRVLWAAWDEADGRIGDAYFVKDLEAAKAMVGKTIWANNATVEGTPKAITADPAASWKPRNAEPLLVLDVVGEIYPHAVGNGSFFLKVRNSSGVEGLVRFLYLQFFDKDPIPASTPTAVRRAIQEQQIMIGMTSEQAILSWGKPQRVNQSVGAWGVHEQWVYPGQYLYFENGKLKSFQSSE